MNLEDFLDIHTDAAQQSFNKELSTDENKDYRRGFRAGVLFSYLHIKSNIRTMPDVTPEPTTD